MQDSNPYQSPHSPSRIGSVTGQQGSRWRWALVGFAIAAAVPVAFGMYGMHQHNLYVASLGPNEAACGMGALGSLAIIFVIGPFCGMIGAGAGWVASGIDWWSAL